MYFTPAMFLFHLVSYNFYFISVSGVLVCAWIFTTLHTIIQQIFIENYQVSGIDLGPWI